LGGKPSQQPTRANHSSDHRILSAEPIADVNDHARARTADVVGSLGAHHIVDYTREDFGDGCADYELIVDVFRRSSVNRLRRALARRGRLLIVGGEGDRWIGGIHRQLGATLLSPFAPQTLRAFVVNEDARYLLKLNPLLAAEAWHRPTWVRSRRPR
jgi:NADPH:quinone reductase-like Zn-dependent oxidoreductase